MAAAFSQSHVKSPTLIPTGFALCAPSRPQSTPFPRQSAMAATLALPARAASLRAAAVRASRAICSYKSSPSRTFVSQPHPHVEDSGARASGRLASLSLRLPRSRPGAAAAVTGAARASQGAGRRVSLGGASSRSPPLPAARARDRRGAVPAHALSRIDLSDPTPARANRPERLLLVLLADDEVVSAGHFFAPRASSSSSSFAAMASSEVPSENSIGFIGCGQVRARWQTPLGGIGIGHVSSVGKGYEARQEGGGREMGRRGRGQAGGGVGAGEGGGMGVGEAGGAQPGGGGRGGSGGGRGEARGCRGRRRGAPEREVEAAWKASGHWGAGEGPRTTERTWHGRRREREGRTSLKAEQRERCMDGCA